MEKGTLTIASRSTRTQGNYVNGDVRIDLNINQDTETAQVKNIDGQVYETSQSEGDKWAGSFNGSLQQNGEMDYSMSGMKRRMLAAIDGYLTDIEDQLSESKEGGEA